jgi:uncharacterized protein (DUF4213/DUF364 family)
MPIINEIIAQLPSDPIPVRKIVIGVHWTLVCSKYAGLASTLVNCGPHGHSHMRDVGSLLRKSAQDLIEWVNSDNLLEASVGIAALNSLIQVDETNLVNVNAAEVIAKHSSGKNLAVIGHFPFVERIKPLTKNCWVIEKKPYGDDFPEEASSDYIPRADVVAITGTAFINHTIDYLLSLCKSDSTVIILGPSTPLSRILLSGRISYLSGTRITDEESAALTIQQGASFPQVGGVRVVTLGKSER